MRIGWKQGGTLFPLIVFFILAGCNPAATPVPTAGVEGHVTIGPTCPAVQAGNPCPDKPYQAVLSILDTRGKKVLAIKTDADGYYHIPLAPGDYVMHPESPDVMPHALEQAFTVQADKFTTLDITYDSGIR